MKLTPEHICLFCKHKTDSRYCKKEVGRPMKNEITALWGCPPYKTWELKPDQFFLCVLYERDTTLPGYQS